MKRTNITLFSTAIIMLLCINITNSSLREFKITKNKQLSDENTIFLQDTERELLPSFSADFGKDDLDIKKVIKLLKKFDYEEVIFKNLSYIKEENIDNLFEALKTQTRVKSLTVTSVISVMITKLSSFLKDRTSLTYIEFSSYSKINDQDSIIEITNAVKSMENLETLILRDFQFSTVKSYEILNEAINRLSNLTKLEISRRMGSLEYDTNLGYIIFANTDAIRGLFQSLMSKKKLTHLNLDGAIANDSQIKLAGDFLEYFTQLKTLSLRYNRLTHTFGIPNAFSSIVKAIDSMSNLENLDISGCSLLNEEVASMADSLANLHELKSFKLHSDYEIDNISSEGIVLIAKSLENKVKLEEFSIFVGESESDSLAILALAKALADKPNLKILRFGTSIDGIEINVSKKFINSLANSNQLHTLKIKGFIINDSNAETLANILVNTNMRILDLSFNDISIKGAAYILDKLGKSDKKFK